MRDFPSKKEREEIDNLKEQMMKLQEESKSKDQRNKLAIDRLKRQLEESNKRDMKGNSILGPIAKECVDLWPKISAAAESVV